MIVSLDGIVCEIGVMTPGDSILLESLVNLECSASVDARAKHGIADAAC